VIAFSGRFPSALVLAQLGSYCGYLFLGWFLDAEETNASCRKKLIFATRPRSQGAGAAAMSTAAPVFFFFFFGRRASLSGLSFCSPWHTMLSGLCRSGFLSRHFFAQ
jgi:hypothetical protein